MAIITPNFNFAGRCEEAIELYQKAFNAKVGCFLRYSEANQSDWDRKLTPEQEKYISCRAFYWEPKDYDV